MTPTNTETETAQADPAAPQSDETKAAAELKAKADAAVAASKAREGEAAPEPTEPEAVPGEAVEKALFDNDTAKELLHCGCDLQDGVEPLGRFGTVFDMIEAGLIDGQGTTEDGKKMLDGWPIVVAD